MTGPEWPAGFERTPAAERVPNRRFGASLAETSEDLASEMGRLDPDEWRVSTGSGGAHTRSNGLPKHSANPDDPSAVVRWSKDGEQFAVACDRYTRLRDNLRAVYLWVRETRLRGDRPVVTGESEFAAARLPSGDADHVAEPPAHAVLDVSPEAGDDAIRAAYREKLKEAHPDHGGSSEAFRRVRDARDELLNDG
jgi:hypothetical protein